jgi:hypothetical protein
MKATPAFEWQYDEGGRHTHSLIVAGRVFSAYVNLKDGKVYFAEGYTEDPRYSGIPCKDFDEANEKVLKVLRKDKAELVRLGI